MAMVAVGQRWVCVRTARRGTVIDIIGTVGCAHGEWVYLNVSALRARQYGKIKTAELHRSWEELES